MATRLVSLHPWLVLAAACAPSVPGAAQQTWVVDSQNRPGTQFTDLPPAIAASQAGDVLLVRDGSYSVATVDKGVQIHAQPGAVVNQGVIFTPNPLVIEDVPAGERVAVHGLTFGTTLFGMASYLEVTNCQGQVHLEDLVFSTLAMGGGSQPSGIDVTDCARVSLARCTATNRSGLRVTRSQVFAHDCAFRGQDEVQQPHFPSFPAAAGVTVTGGAVELSRCVARGGNAGGQYGVAGAAGILLSGGQVTVTGVQGTAVSAGRPRAGGSGHFAIDGAGAAIVDPLVQLASSGSAAPAGPGVQLSLVETPSLTVSSVMLGGQKTGDLRAGPGQPFVVMVGLPAEPLPLPFGTVWLDLSFVLVGASGTMGPTGIASWSFPAPTTQPFFGQVFTWQAAALTGSGLRMSTAGEYVIR